ncbi:MAG TPA: hypothetical protein VK784_14170, partial [Pseudonocardiaceae bacterium]|nr:hypothetical protein [Pseudonocardiaceae bacterium]
EPESDVPAPDESVPLFEDESVPLFGSDEVDTAGAAEVGAGVVVAGTEVPLLQPARRTIKPLATIRQPLWNLMLATTPQRVQRCATVMLFRSLRGQQVRYLWCCVLGRSWSPSPRVSHAVRSAAV